MLVSGLTIERKKISEQKHGLKSKKKKDQRPFSSQLPLINETMRGSNAHLEGRFYVKDEVNPSVKQEKRTKERHSSINKTSMTAKLVLRKNHSTTKQFPHSRQQMSKNPSTKLSLKQIKQLTTTTSKHPTQHEQKKPPKKRLQLATKGQLLNNSSTRFASLLDEEEKEKITKYYRYYPMVIIQSCLKREAFMLGLMENGDVEVYNTNKLTTKKKKTFSFSDIMQPWAKLLKLAQLKGKYKYREKFNFNNSAQLKAIKWKRKEVKKRKQSTSTSSDDDEKKQKCRDMQTWKKAMGVQGSKVFICKGKYTDFRNALLQRGWVQNPDKHSSFFDLKWTTKVSDITFESLKPNQIVNHFNNNACLTSKYGICKSLRSIMYSEQVDIDRFFPKAFDMSDCSDFQNFLEVYKWTFCESILKSFLLDENQSNVRLQVLKIAFVIITRRLSKPETIIKHTLAERYFVASIEQWLAINDPQKSTFDQFNQVFHAWDISHDTVSSLKQKTTKLLQRLQTQEPQYHINGNKNIWIVKPAFLSRGRGIKCLNKFTDILNYSLGKETQFVVQKYIQNPLIINKKKFDIRQWVLVEDYNPPRIWMYDEFYCRFCVQEYDEDKITNRFAHLTNNSVQKYNKNLTQAELKQKLKESMWTQQELEKFIQETYKKGEFKTIRQKLKEIIISTILSTADQIHARRNSFELIGYDFMIDDALNPWLIEINTSPAMDYSTPVTQRLVKMVLEDVVKVVVDLRKKKGKKKTAGMFKCIYNGEEPFVSRHYNLLQKNCPSKQE